MSEIVGEEIQEQSPTEDYTYLTLDADRKEFRLLDLHPLWPDTPRNYMLKCTMRHAYFDDTSSPKYETVSYVWGDPTPCKELLVNGKRLRVPKNTEHILRQLAFHDRTRVLWIDAACINQADLEERSQQVRLMGHVYKSGSCNLINLGEADDLMRRAIRNLDSIVNEIRDSTDNYVHLYEIMIVDSKWVLAESAPKVALDTDALVHFYSRPWFRRVWVVQEALLAVKNRCICGSASISFEGVVLAAAWLFRYHGLHIPKTLCKVSGIANAANMFAQTFYDNRTVNIGYAISMSTELETSDARDKVFGMLGIVNVDCTQAISRLIVPNYTKDVSEVFRDAVRYHIETTNDCSVISWISHRSNDDITANSFPSWVPRFDRELHSGLEPERLFNVYSRRFGRCLDGSEDHRYFRDEEDVLHLHGVATGVIAYQSAVFHRSNRWSFLEGVFNAVTYGGLRTSRFARCLSAEISLQARRDRKLLEIEYEHCLSHYTRFGWQQLRRMAPADADEQLKGATCFLQAMVGATTHRRFAITESGMMALVPKVSNIGDIIVSFHGGYTPFVVRKLECGGYHLLGECYLEDHMDGEAFEKQKAAGTPDELFRIR